MRWPLGLALCAAAGVSLASDPPTLSSYVLGEKVLVAAAGDGRILTVDMASHLYRLWSAEGMLQSSKVIEDARLEGEVFLVASRGDSVLLAYFDPMAGSENERKLVTVNALEGKVKHVFGLPGVVISAAPGPEGWLLLLRQLGLAPASRPFSLLLVDDYGKKQGDYPMPEELGVRIKDKQISNPGAWVVRPFVAGSEAWFAPLASYELWRPKQRAKEATAVKPPDCLAAEGRLYFSEEADAELRARTKGATGETREVLDKYLKRGRESGSPPTGFVGALAAVTGYRRQVAVVVRDRNRADRGCRVDIWDLAQEQLVDLVQLPEGVCPAVLALTADAIWFPAEHRMQRVVLPRASMATPLVEPCVEAAKGLPAQR